MDELVIPGVIVGILTVLSPFITALFTKLTMSSKAKGLIALAVSLVIAAVWVLMTGGFEGVSGVEELAVPLGVVFGLQQLVYNQFFKTLTKSVETGAGVGARQDQGYLEDSSEDHLEDVDVEDTMAADTPEEDYQPKHLLGS